MRAVRLAAETGLEAAVSAGYSRRSIFRWSQLFKANCRRDGTSADRAWQRLTARRAASPATTTFHRLGGTLGWRTPAERYLGVPFADHGFKHIAALEHLQPWLKALMATAA
jgi:hypothetical protein